MEIAAGFYQTFKLSWRYITYQFQQARLTTSEHEVINTSHGKVRGVKHENAYKLEESFYAFEGLPYAKPPLGELRFRAPQPAEPWQGVLNCTKHKSKPNQVNPLFGFAEGSEDCLYLNIYVKKLKSDTRLPVMVWIYGGAFQYGEASTDHFAPDFLMMHDVILVTFNYRLGVFGFLSLDDPDLNIPGNAGIKDQVLALQWINENIHNFNGDPNNITVFGESAGAASTHMLMLSPQAKGLFHKAIMQSGSAFASWICTDHRDWGYKLALHLGYDGDNIDKDVYSYLVKQDAKRLAGKIMNLVTKHDVMINNISFAFAPVVEPYITKGCITNKPIKELLPNAWGNGIPLILGGNSAEGLFHYNYAKMFPEMIDELNCCHQLPDEAKRGNNIDVLEQMGRQLNMMYFQGETPNANDHLIPFLELLGHRAIWLPIYREIRERQASAAIVPTYCYMFDFVSRSFNIPRIMLCSDASVEGACHGDEIFYLFRTAFCETLSPTQREFKCIQRMVGMWYNFALTSNPNCDEISPTIWETVQKDDVDDAQKKPFKCLFINDDVEFKELPIHDKLEAWTEFYTCK